MKSGSAIKKTLGLLAVPLIAGCASQAPVPASDNFAYLYGKGAAAMRLEARVYQPDPEHAVIYFKLRTADLLYKGSGGGGPYDARVVMHYEAMPSPGSQEILDSASTFVKDRTMDPQEDKALVGSMEMKNVGDRSFTLRVTAHDLNRDTQSTIMLPVERGVLGGRQEFLPLAANGVPLFNDRIPAGTSIKVRAEQHTGAVLHVAHFPPVAQLPAPVFADVAPPKLNTPPDSSFTVQVGADGMFSFTMGRSGFYQFRADTASHAGYTLFMSDPGFPKVTNARELLAPLRYISSQKEWQGFHAAPDPRKAVERFWTDAAGSRDRAREAIAAYYGRVESANRHFTSYVDGWRTDRGLVHIIFGTPNTIRKNNEGETWVYGDETNLMSLTFTFVKRNEPFSDNDLVLRRDPMLKSAWYRNVESWRNGRILQN